MQENETLASNSNIKIVQRAALLQIAAGALPDTTGYVFVNELCQINMQKTASREPSRSLHGPSRIATKSQISKSFT